MLVQGWLVALGATVMGCAMSDDPATINVPVTIYRGNSSLSTATIQSWFANVRYQGNCPD